ncbi:hypothetical protein NDA11_006706 [Ustilago hordei]|uniref:Uncharacterized protein n=1 Tax=Ustilago hordei TaxID=120017 RepID=I2FVX3_USTHO|nr:uncharacterized protein UHO2_04588 [Ustilago hordei]KAJ1578109.1 hypothetical protein NDA12_005013 [Ustilago hordei]KAJ1578440.1 hypothetical protein NDA11_006706 [Ustilago hordei]KAJ1592346.1 hypothetical protein NDA15_000091 [Ustilago hordei]CCF51066.1 uncharacterized protein UHOR_06978 [Ustilago hordei]SYW84657.1 uncharacterized protein UHO2_04588 [Ustilago hordei]
MADNTKMQAGAGRAKGGRKGKAPQLRVADNEVTNETEAEVTDDEANEETNSDSDQDSSSKQYNFCTLGTYDKKHPKWNCAFDDAMMNAVWKKIENGLTNEATTTSCQIALIAQLGKLRMFNSDAQKLIQEIRSIQTESSLLGKPFANDTLFSNLQKCTICHPMYKEMVATISQLTFNTLATALTIQQSAIENYPAQKVDPHQASARVASSNDQDEPTLKDGRDEKDEDNTNAKVTAQP